LSNCPGINPGIQKCKENGKKVLLSVGGGWPTDYYIETEEIAEYFAEFLWGAFGPEDAAWVAAGKPRPFGDASVDGFDLDIESWIEVAPFEGYQYKNYAAFVTHLKKISSNAALISAAVSVYLRNTRENDANVVPPQLASVCCS
jgi:chitinase